MTVGIRVGSITDEIGGADFLHAFFSTVSAKLERRWGERFPSMMELYQGALPSGQALSALNELNLIRLELSHYAPSEVVWDIEDRSKRPPWGDGISSDITNLSNYFVTSTGRDLIDVIQEALEASRDEAKSAEIVSY